LWLPLYFICGLSDVIINEYLLFIYPGSVFLLAAENIWMASEEASVCVREIAISAAETTVRDAVSVAGVMAATSILGDYCRSTEYLIVVDLQASECADDVGGEGMAQSVSNCELSLPSVVSSHDDVVDNTSYNCSSPSPPRSHSRLGRMLGRLTMRGGRRQTPDSKRCPSWTECSRRVIIESSLSATRSASRRRRPTTPTDDCDFVNHDHDADRPREFATSLTSTEVRDGKFAARLPVDVLPRGDIMIRMRRGRLELVQVAPATGRCVCGVIELPMYVDVNSVTVRHDALQQSLVIEANTKGCRRRSLSVDELWWPRGRRIARELSVRLIPTTWMQQRDGERDESTVVLCSETRAVACASDDTSRVHHDSGAALLH